MNPEKEKCGIRFVLRTCQLFSGLHGEYGSFSRLLLSASGTIRVKIDLVFEKACPPTAAVSSRNTGVNASPSSFF